MAGLGGFQRRKNAPEYRYNPHRKIWRPFICSGSIPQLITLERVAFGGGILRDSYSPDRQSPLTACRLLPRAEPSPA